jgi:benzoyl-CoA reductase/2-hydroxyglutaryl-CoA dehydratase subunit BcrC/BadD/HgdB
MTATATDPIAQLSFYYENPMAGALEASAAGIPVIGVTSNTVPWELIAASGMFPVVLRTLDSPTPWADEFMEPGIFLPQIRSIFDQIVAGRWPLHAVIIPRTSEQEYKLFLYLREIARQYPDRNLPPIYLYDLPHCQSQESEAYGFKVTIALKEQLERLSGNAITEENLVTSVEDSNEARASVRSLLSLRHGTPRISGVSALSLIGPFWALPRSKYRELAGAAIEELQGLPPLSRPRILVKGVSLDQLMLHSTLESHGAVVVSEDDWWGERSAGGDISSLPTPLVGCFNKYYFGSPSPRVFPSTVADSWFEERSRENIDGVAFYLPGDDYVAGWDYPKQKRFLDAVGIPSLPVRHDARQIDAQDRARVTEWVEQLDSKAPTR